MTELQLPTIDLLTLLRPMKQETVDASKQFVVIAADDGKIDRMMAKAVATELLLDDGEFVAVIEQGCLVGAVATADLVAALPPDDLVPDLELLKMQTERSPFGNPDVKPIRYQCRICSPPTVQFVRRSGSDAPLCPKVVTHGPMKQ